MLLVYVLPIAIAVLWTHHRKRSRYEKHKLLLEENVKAGLTEPASLHPLIDPNLCIGCNSCAEICPEGDVIGVIEEKAALINPTLCIGHGACAEACPVDAITLVFGTEKRGVDIPYVNEYFETNIPGIFIAGELGGMGLIRNAIEQGRQAMESICQKPGIKQGNDLDVVIIGAGPAGFSATLGAHMHQLRYVTVEQETLGGTVAHFPRGKLVMTQPAELPIVGTVKFTEISKEKLLGFWHKVGTETKIRINFKERMESIMRTQTGFEVTTSKNTYRTKNVLLTIGRRGTPRKLGVPGEQLSKVVYRLIDPEQYRNQSVLVVGGGDSALEAAASIAEEPGTQVILSYRSGAFTRAKQKNRQRVADAERRGNLAVMLQSNVKEILADKVVIDHNGKVIEAPNNAVIISAGGVLPTGMLKELGINIETKHGTV
ncbi:MAG: 4Fe-4S ferredoxin [Gammaproteobacteria bacterium SG8_15]|nr:MAG: 4Fe-4S ferredoxin [Gammaproteobacteria bacterium SG8_15]